MSRHQRLQRNINSPARAARRAKKQRRQAKYPEGRPREHEPARLPVGWLETVWASAKRTAAR